MVGVGVCDRRHPTSQVRRLRSFSQLSRILQSVFQNQPSPQHDHRDSVPRREREAGRAVASWLGPASAVAPACDKGGCGALRSFGACLLIRPHFPFLQRLRIPCSSSLWVKHALGKDGSADPNCTVLTTNLGDWTDCGREQCGGFEFRRRS